MKLTVNLDKNSYDIHIERGGIRKAAEYFNLDRKVLIVSDSGVPTEYAKMVADQCKNPVFLTVPMGEESKSMDLFTKLCQILLLKGFTRTDAIVAVGGGVCGDLAGYVAASFMRGIDFYNIPTTLLSMVDSSIGGKTAINFEGVKNILGAFHQPKGVIIDPDLLTTLPKRQMANGMAEVIKMAATFDAALFAELESNDPYANMETIILKSLKIKKAVVEQDEKESGLRRVLNFGHTIGHGIESYEKLHGLYHGECVALGMLPMCSADVKTRLLSLYDKYELPKTVFFDAEMVYTAATHDKKADGDTVYVITVPTVGTYEMKKIPLTDLHGMIKEAFPS